MVLGVRAHELRDMLTAGDRSLILAASPERLAELARLGPGALYYGARAAGLDGDAEREGILLQLASEREDGLFRRRAWELLEENLYRRRDWAGLLYFSERQAKAGIDAYLPRRRRAESMAALGRLAEARAELEALAAAYPAQTAGDAAILSALRFRTAPTSEEKAVRLRELFALPSARAEDMEEALTAAEAWDPGAASAGPANGSGPGSPFTEAELSLFRLRARIARRDYGAAYRALAPAIPLLSPSLPRIYLSDAGKAFLYAPALGEGIAVMTALETAAGEARETEYIAVFYRARMLRQADRRAEAAADFARAWELAPSGEDRDAAAWYRADSFPPGSRTEAAAWLARTAPTWSSAAGFADIVERLGREALLARDGETLHILRSEVSARMTPRAAARLVYLAGRAAETGIAPPGTRGEAMTPAEYARSAFEEVLRRSPEPYYRLLASHRLGLPLVEIPPSRPIEPLSANAGRVGRRAAPDTEAYLVGFAEYGLAELISLEIRALEGSPDAVEPETLRRLALRLRDAGNPAQSMLTINRLLENPGYEVSREDWELLWPRPWPRETSETAAKAGMEEHLLYGLVRSESFFRPRVVSRAGAVGLAQLMPATAEETARRLRMGSYDLENPEDNLRLGSAHFAGLLRVLGGRVLPSVFAYNAGLSRMRGWERAAPGFPDDLLLESLSIEETRQYGRNVLWASVVYGVLHYGLDAESALARMLGER